MSLKVSVPPSPTKPAFLPPEQVEQLCSTAPPASVFDGDSASYEVASGGVAAPAETLRPLNVTWPGWPAACEVMNIPASWVAAWPGTVAEPTGSQSLPSKE